MMIWTEIIVQEGKINELLAGEKWSILATFSQLRQSNSRPSFNMQIRSHDSVAPVRAI